MNVSVLGVGINDFKGKPKPLNYKQIYRIWANMLKRCYYESYHNKKPTYESCTTCEDWKTLSKFSLWVETQDWKGKDLDKDLLVPGNKQYSPEFCCFIDKRINSFITDRVNSRGNYPLGVSFHKASGKFVAQIHTGVGYQKHLGLFESPEYAHQAWLNTKLELAVELAKDLPHHIGKALISRYQKNKEFL